MVGFVLGSHFLENACQNGGNMFQHGIQIGAEAGPGRDKLYYFLPWVIKVAQVMPNGDQSCSEGGKRVYK